MQNVTLYYYIMFLKWANRETILTLDLHISDQSLLFDQHLYLKKKDHILLYLIKIIVFNRINSYSSHFPPHSSIHHGFHTIV